MHPGPPKKPSRIEIAEGRPGKRKLNPLEPKPAEMTAAAAVSACPPEFTDNQREWWAYYAATFADCRVLAEADLVMLEKLARVSDERERMETQLAKVGPLYRNDKTGSIKISPLFSIVDRLRDVEFRMLREFGASPAARTGVNMISAPDHGSELLTMLSQPRNREAVQ